MSSPQEPTLETVLRRVDLFADLEEDDLRGLGRRFVDLTLDSHSRIYSNGEPAEHFFVIRRGEVAIFRDEVGKPVSLQARLGPGEYFGEMGLLGDYERTSSARTSVTTRLLRIDKRSLLDFLDQHPAVALKIQIAAARRHSEKVTVALDLGMRKEVRIRLQRNVVIDTPFRQHRAVLENLSFGGLCLRRAPAAWSAGGEVRFDLIYDVTSLPVEARVSWQEDDAVGLAFLTRDSDHEERVQRFLRLLLH